MNKEIVIEEGTLDDFLKIITASYNDYMSNNFVFKMYESISTFFKSFQQINKLVRSKENVAHHYDIDEKMYKLFLDKDMQYSCAYFHNQNIGIDQAQFDKKKHIIEKLQIKEGMSVLDIGCGWGGMAIQIAKDTGARVKGITLSENQFKIVGKVLVYENNEVGVHHAIVTFDDGNVEAVMAVYKYKDGKETIVEMFDEKFLRMWEFYLLISKYSFINMGNVVFQIQIAKNINNLPLTRNYIYN